MVQEFWCNQFKKSIACSLPARGGRVDNFKNFGSRSLGNFEDSGGGFDLREVKFCPIFQGWVLKKMFACGRLYSYRFQKNIHLWQGIYVVAHLKTTMEYIKCKHQKVLYNTICCSGWPKKNSLKLAPKNKLHKTSPSTHCHKSSTQVFIDPVQV